MRTVERLFFQYLAPQIAPAKLYAVIVPQDARYPCVRYATTFANPDSTLCGYGGLTNSNVQIDIWAREFTDVRNLRDIIVHAMQQAPLDPTLTAEFDNYDADAHAYIRVLQYSIWENETV